MKKNNLTHKGNRTYFLNLKWPKTLTLLFLIGANLCEAQQSLYATDYVNWASRLIIIDEVTGTTTPIMEFPASLGQVGRLTYAPDQSVFYAFGDFNNNNPNKLLRINSNDSTFVELGNVTLNGNLVYYGEGLAYDPVSEVLYATVTTIQNSYESNRLVTLDETTAAATLIGDITQSPSVVSNEMDVLEFTGTANINSTLLGLDGSPGFTAVLYSIDYNTVSPGTAVDILNYNGNTHELGGGLAYLESTDVVYYAGHSNGVLGTLNPLTGTIDTTTINVNGSGLIFGLAWGDSPCHTLDLTQIKGEVNIQISPNPFKDVLNIDFGPDFIQKKTITLYDLQGRKMIEIDCLSETAISIDTRELIEGTYVIYVNDRLIGKAIKQ